MTEPDSPAGEAAMSIVAETVILHRRWLRTQFEK